ncbi:insulin-degrading enzyme [Planococcus citri]|uniref:insulin-degrading enzyme n=1 Tax=Planococcus citri TaxID=170843 RepID=UPI0031F745E1
MYKISSRVFIRVVDLTFEKLNIRIITKHNMGTYVQKNCTYTPKRYENIKKSIQDKRLYRGLTLNNGLRALLISDPTTDKSAASLTVNVGALNDGAELPGLAHFLEHMLFLGSKKYPEENDYQKYVSEHAGHTNAYTAEHQTNFFFDIGPDFLPGALDRFAQFFIEPLFDDSATQREVNAVNSEHEKNIPADQWRVRQLEKSNSKAGHPYNHFSTGNKDTLDVIPKSKGIEIRKKLLDFHNTWYSANIMCLAVLGRESLDELENLVSNLFDDVNNKDVECPIYNDHPYGSEQLKRKFYVVPVKDIRSLKISFSAPDVIDQYRTSPEHYVSNLIGHEGPGSLHAILRERSLCNSLSAGLSYTAPGFGFFTINADLTEEAMDKIDDIITLVFQYIKLLKTEGIQEWIFEENKKLEEMMFMFKDKESPSSYVMTLAAAMHHYPIEDILSANYIIDEWKPELISSLLKYLTPENMKVIVVSKSFESIATEVEPWYGTKYKIEPIPDDLIMKWKEVDVPPKEVLHLPPPNEFVPENFDLFPLDANAPKNPTILYESRTSRVWYKQDDEYLLPKLNVHIELFSPLAFLDPGNYNLTNMFVFLLKDALNEYAYAAKLAGLSWNITSTKNGVLLGLSGYNEKLPVLLDRVIDRMVTFQVDPKRFEIIREAFIRSLKNFEADQPHQHANFFLSYALTEYGYNKEELLDACDVLNEQNLMRFLPDFFSHIYMQVLIHGNCSNNVALHIVKLCEDPFKSACGLLPQQLLPYREVNLEYGSHFVYEIYNKVHSSSCFCAYYQCSLESTANNTIIELFAQIINEPCFNVLRTQEQLGYIVMSGVRRNSGVQGLIILVQSEKHPVYLNSRVEEFLKSMQPYIEKMTDEEFETHKTTLATRKLEKPKQLAKLTNKFWGEISSRYYNFDRVEMEVKYLSTLKKDDVLNFYKDSLLINSSHRRKLAIHVISKVTNPSYSKELEEKAEKIEDVTLFKNSLSLCPLPKPYMNIPPVGTKSKL